RHLRAALRRVRGPSRPRDRPGLAAVPGRLRPQFRGGADGGRPDPGCALQRRRAQRDAGDAAVGGDGAGVSGFAGSALLAALPWAALADVAVLAVTFAVAKVAGKHSLIDTAWGLLFVAVAVAVFLASSGHGDPVRRWLLLVLPTLWGLRLAQHIGRRTVGRPEDPRYVALLAKARGNP